MMPDKQGRVRISEDHKEYAGMQAGNEVVIIGQVDKFEIWDKARYKAMLIDTPIDDVADELAESGIDFPL